MLLNAVHVGTQRTNAFGVLMSTTSVSLDLFYQTILY